MIGAQTTTTLHYRRRAASHINYKKRVEQNFDHPDSIDVTENYILAKRMETDEFSDDPDSDNYWFIWFEGEPPVDTGDTIT